MTITDAELMRSLQDGQRAAFTTIIDRHQRAVYGYLRARLNQANDAEDMTQEVFLRFYEARARFDSNNLIRPWLLGIARNLLREHMRSLRKRKEVGWTELCLELEKILPFTDDGSTDVLEHLPVCLAELGPSAKQAIEMKYRSDQRLSEIGKTLHRSEGAVKLLMHRARLALKTCLEQKLRKTQA